jgi:cell division transport system ATP-binding protein
MPILEFCGVTKVFGSGRERRAALADVEFAVEEGSLALLTGPSGAGKSTLLKLVLAVERPDSGTIRVGGRDIARLRRSSIPYLRRNVGAVFQDFKLLQDASPLENVALALQAVGRSRKEVMARASAALQSVELDPELRRPCRCLSGGEQQRVAIARALVGDPAVLLADEPTGNLDPRLTSEILDLLQVVRGRGTTIVLATHDPLVGEHLDPSQVLALDGGRLVLDSAAPTRAREPATSASVLHLHTVGATA